MSRELPRPGALVAYWEDNGLALAVVAGEDQGRLRIVTARSRIERVTAGRVVATVERAGEAPGEGVESLRAAGRRVSETDRHVTARASEVDVPLLWQIVLEDARGETDRSYGPDDLAELALGRRDGPEVAAVLRALHADGLHFTRRAERFEPRAAAEVEDLRHSRERSAERERQVLGLHAALRRAVGGERFEPEGTEHETRCLDALARYAVYGDGAMPADRETALASLGASGLRWDSGPEGAFRLLRILGRFDSDDENLAVLRLGLARDFPEAVTTHARGAAACGFERSGREDLTGLEIVSIDAPATREIDDALSIEPLADGAVRLGVHLADPGAFVAPGDPVDTEAVARGLTHYHPDVRIPMLPPSISEDAASLVAGQDRPALSVIADLDATGALRATRCVRSIVRSAARLDYAGFDRTVRDGDGPFAALLGRLAEIGRLREARRIERGAVVLDAAEVDVFADPDGAVRIERTEPGSPSRRAVAEAMVLAGEVVAAMCQSARLAAIYRRQAPPAEPWDPPAQRIDDPILVRRVRRRMLRAEVGTTPGRHAGLGLEAYVQVTSALRRYQDLATQRQIAAHLEGAPAPYDLQAMLRLAGATERAEADARRAERSVNDYWTLRYLAVRQGEEVEALVVDLDPRPIVQLVETLWEQPVSALAGVAVGSRVSLRIERVNPRAGILVLR